MDVHREPETSNKSEGEEEKRSRRRHFVLVHGSCHGAWCWYKVAAFLESAGHAVTALDMAACGVDPKSLDDVHSVSDYYRPLMDYFARMVVPNNERVVIVGHSFGGVGVSMAMEAFPTSIDVAVFVAASIPSPSLSLAETLEEFSRRNPRERMLDTKFSFDQGLGNPPTSVIIGPNMLSSKFYNKCTRTDVKLAEMLVRPSRVYTKEMAGDIQFTEERFGSVARACVLCKDERAVDVDFQRFVIQRTPPSTEVQEIDGADHMVMISKPQELSNCLLAIAEKLA